MKLSHSRAVLLMLVVTLLWSVAGVVSRHLQAAQSFEVTFWRSAACAVTMAVVLAWQRGGVVALGRSVRVGGALMWWSGLCWAVMFTAFMMALTLTTVANVLITMALGPLFTALIARVVLGQRLALRTWCAIVVAGLGIGWMFGSQLLAEPPPGALAGAAVTASWVGTLVSLTVPIGGATMWALAQHNAARHAEQRADLMLAVLIGALLSAAATLPLAWPMAATPRDLVLLSGLGVVQLAIPCLLAVSAGKVLKAPEAALLGLLEILFGVTWTWLGTTESPTPAVLGGGALVIGALAANEGWALWGARGSNAGRDAQPDPGVTIT
ncbi:MAG: DMT family transporter [Leptothrix sp. (in: b-proteobacteria)]